MRMRDFVKALKSFEGKEITDYFLLPSDGSFPIRYFLERVSNRRIILIAFQNGRSWRLYYTPRELYEKLDNYSIFSSYFLSDAKNC